MADVQCCKSYSGRLKLHTDITTAQSVLKHAASKTKLYRSIIYEQQQYLDNPYFYMICGFIKYHSTYSLVCSFRTNVFIAAFGMNGLKKRKN